MRSTRLGGQVLLVLSVAVLAHAAKPEDAPPESRAQVEAALKALAPALSIKPDRPKPTKPGTIEFAIASYAPLKFHKVVEGILPAPRADATCPPEMAAVGGRFCIDRWEASLVERLSSSEAGDAGLLGGSESPHAHYLPPEDGHVYVARSRKGVFPQAYISASQAQAACAAAGKRLCHPVEWRAACGGSEGYAYPYGPTRVAGKCHDSGAAPMLVFHASTMKTPGWGKEQLNDPRNLQLANTVGKTGDYPECINDYGVYDMVGNLHEWTADPNGTFQGGYWLDTSQHGDGCAYRTIAHGYTYHDYSTGFRCCSDAGTSGPSN